MYVVLIYLLILFRTDVISLLWCTYFVGIVFALNTK
jgi:hypothetical protein